MRTLVTTSRMPFAVDEIRKLGQAGHDVTAVDTFKASPGSHSRSRPRRLEVPPPAQETEAFIDAISRIIDEQQIQWLLPMSRRSSTSRAHRDRLEGRCELFFPDFPTLAKVHDKVTFSALGRDVGLSVAESVTATSPEELLDATGRFDRLARGLRARPQHPDEHGTARGGGQPRRCRADAGRSVAGAGVPRRRGPVQLERRAPR